MKAGAITGGATGALQGYGQGEGVGDRLIRSALGGAVGGVAGAALPVATKSLADVARNILPGSSQKAAARLVDDAIEQSGLSREAIEAGIQNLGPEGALVDAIGDQGQALARNVMNKSVPGRSTLRNLVENRAGGATDRIRNALMETAGFVDEVTPTALMRQVDDAARPAIQRAYDAARSAGQDLDVTPFQQLLQTNLGGKAFKQGSDIANDLAAVQGRKATNFEIMDATKKALDDFAQPNIGQDPSSLNIAAGDMSRVLRSSIDDVLPEYGGARQLARELYQTQDAIQAGANAAKGTVKGNAVEAVKGVRPENRPDALRGLVAGKLDELNSRRDNATTINSLFNTDNKKAPFKELALDQGQRIFNQLNAENAFQDTARAIRGNSTVQQTSEAGNIVQALSNPKSAALNALGKIGLQPSPAQQSEINAIVAEILAGRSVPQEVLNNPYIQRELAKVVGTTTGNLITEK